MLLPPRKLDLYTFSLAGTCVGSGQYLYFGSRPARFPLPGASSTSTEEKDGERRREEEEEAEVEEDREGKEEKGKEKENEEGDRRGVRGLIRNMWMGSEREGWQARRLHHERERLEDGVGYGGLILEQVREVLGGGKGEGES